MYVHSRHFENVAIKMHSTYKRQALTEGLIAAGVGSTFCWYCLLFQPQHDKHIYEKLALLYYYYYK